MRWSNIKELQSNIRHTYACGLWLRKQLADSWYAKIDIPCMLLSPQLKLYIKYGKTFRKLNLNPKPISHQLFLILENGVDQTYCRISPNLEPSHIAFLRHQLLRSFWIGMGCFQELGKWSQRSLQPLVVDIAISNYYMNRKEKKKIKKKSLMHRRNGGTRKGTNNMVRKCFWKRRSNCLKMPGSKFL